MSKDVLVLSSSPREGGNSELLCDEFVRGAREAGNRAERIRLRERRIGYCTGCGACFEGRRPCPQQDDMATVLERMVAADVIVMATPVYFYSMAAQMKTLIDRCCARYTELADKELYFLVTAADGRREALERTVEGFRGFAECLEGAAEKGVVYGTGVWKAGEVRTSPALQQAYEMGRNV